MKCAHYQRCIYLFDELDTNEKGEVLDHIASCPACHQCYQRMQQERLIVKTTITVPEIEDALLTARIMNAIENRQPGKVPALDRCLHFLHRPPARFTLGTLSCVMIIFFLAELFRTPGPGVVIASDEALPKTVTLNATLYRQFKQLRKDRQSWNENALSLHSCIQACLNGADPDCADCKTRYAKLKHHENI